ncbi:MAG: flagellar basal body P-ring formation protein FlgA [Desulfobacterales bacterium]|nr:flagellar basal body P-ring formation protein FlgA [Desulfobacterales bacterium]
MSKIHSILTTATGTVLVALALIMAAAPWALAAPGRVDIRIQEAVLVPADRIRLVAIARIDADDPRLVETLGALEVGRAPQPGQSLQLGRQSLLLRLKQAGLDERQIRFSGAESVTVTRATVTLTEASIAQAATDWVLAHQPYNPERVRVTGVQTAGDMDLPSGNVTYRVEPPEAIDFLRPVPLSIEFSVDGKPQKRAWATVNLTIMAPVVVSRNPMARYQTVAETDVDVELRDLTTLSGLVISDPAEVVGQRMRRSIGSHTAMRSDLVELPPVVRRGDVVTIVAESGGLRVTALGKVRGLARRGERIGVVNLGSGRTVHARVIDARTVTVDF